MFRKKSNSIFEIDNLNLLIRDLDSNDLNNLVNMCQNKIKHLFNLGKHDELVDNFFKNEDLYDEMFKKRFKNDLKCPRCGNSEYSKNGITNNRQRYICKNCRKTFDERTYTPISNTKLSLETWLKYCKFMVEGGTIKQCASKSGVSIPTSFFMRHRILDVVNFSLKDQVFDGLVCADIQFLNESFKGKSINKTIEEERFFSNFNTENLRIGLFTFMNYQSFSKNPEKNIKPIQVMINTAMDKNNNILSRIAEKGPFKPNSGEKSETIMSFFDGRMSKDAILCVFDSGKYREEASALNIKLKKTRSRMRERLYTVRPVFQYNLQLKDWLKNFNGVATKYLNNYLSWHALIFKMQKLTKSDRIYDLFMEFATTKLPLTKEKIKNRAVELIPQNI